ncbi:MAG: hypothetical protein ACR2PA_07940, partial [Hyphomicrobiaceae bacterium]
QRRHQHAGGHARPPYLFRLVLMIDHLHWRHLLVLEPEPLRRGHPFVFISNQLEPDRQYSFSHIPMSGGLPTLTRQLNS